MHVFESADSSHTFFIFFFFLWLSLFTYFFLFSHFLCFFLHQTESSPLSADIRLLSRLFLCVFRVRAVTASLAFISLTLFFSASPSHLHTLHLVLSSSCYFPDIDLHSSPTAEPPSALRRAHISLLPLHVCKKDIYRYMYIYTYICMWSLSVCKHKASYLKKNFHLWTKQKHHFRLVLYFTSGWIKL